MKQVLKYLTIVLLSVLLVFSAVSWVLFQQKNGWLLDQLRTFVNESQSGRLEVGTMELKVLGSFPDLEILFNDVYYYAVTDSTRTNPILQVDEVGISVKLIPLLREQVHISDLYFSTGKLWLTKDSVGHINLVEALAPPKKEVTQPRVKQPAQPAKPKASEGVKPKTPSPTPTTKPAAVQINLRQVALEEIQFLWRSFQADTTRITIQSLSVKMKRVDDSIRIRLQSEHDLQKIAVADNAITMGQGNLYTEVKFDEKSKALRVVESKLVQGGIEATIKGTSNFKDKKLDVELDAVVLELEFLESILNPRLLRGNPDLLRKGRIFFNAKAVGPFDQVQSSITFGARDISWKVPGKEITFNNLGFNGQFESGPISDFSQATLSIRDIRGQLPGGSIRGFFNLENFKTPYVSYDLKLNANLRGYDEVFNLKPISELTGEIELETRYTGLIKAIAKQDSSRGTRILCKNISFVVNRTGQRVTDLNALMNTRNDSTFIRNFSFSYGKNQLTAEMKFDRNLALFFMNRKPGLRTTGHFSAPVVYTNDFLFDTLMHAKVQERMTEAKFDFDLVLLPDSIRQHEKAFIDLSISNFSTKFDKLTDIRELNFTSRLSRTKSGLSVALNHLQLLLPHGEVQVAGGVTINAKRLDIETDLDVNQFPLNYISDLTAEMNADEEPRFKNTPPAGMDLITGTTKLSASLVPRPFDILSIGLFANQIHLQAPGSRSIHADEVSIQIDSLLFNHPKEDRGITGLLAGAGKASIKTLKFPSFAVDNIQSMVHGFNDTLQMHFACVTQKSKSEQGVLQIDFTGKSTTYDLSYRVEEADLGTYVQEYFHKKLMDGKLNYQVQLKTEGNDLTSLRQNAVGTIEISSDSVTLYGIDVDDVLKRYRRSQNFNLTDLGAVLVAGPIGLAVTKGTSFVSLATVKLNEAHHTQVDTLYARWNLDKLQLQSADVAFATSLNRIAIQGHVDFANSTIPGLTIAVVDKMGCSLMDQKLSGSFSNVEVGKLNIAKTIIGSVINFVSAVAGGNCTPVYTGAVKHPK